MLNRDKAIKKEINILRDNIDKIKDILIKNGFTLFVNSNYENDILLIITSGPYELLVSTLNLIVHHMNLKHITMNIEIVENNYLVRAEDIYSIFY